MYVKEQQQQQKQPYIKPTLRIIELAAKEVLGTTCMFTGSSQFVQYSDPSNCAPVDCQFI